MTNDIQTLATQAAEAIHLVQTATDPQKPGDPAWYQEHTFYSNDGIEVIEGWFNLYSSRTGQSATVVYHLESNLVFKTVSNYRDTPDGLSRKALGMILINGVDYPVRLPEYGFVRADNLEMQYQEYVPGAGCGCDSTWCEHASAMAEVTGCEDCHTGNWKITPDGEVILFDFENIRVR